MRTPDWMLGIKGDDMSDGITQGEKDNAEYENSRTRVAEPVYRHELKNIIAQAVEQTLAKVREQEHAKDIDPEIQARKELEESENYLKLDVQKLFMHGCKVVAYCAKKYGYVPKDMDISVRDKNYPCISGYLTRAGSKVQEYFSAWMYNGFDIETLQEQIDKCAGKLRVKLEAEDAGKVGDKNEDKVPF